MFGNSIYRETVSSQEYPCKYNLRENHLLVGCVEPRNQKNEDSIFMDRNSWSVSSEMIREDDESLEECAEQELADLKKPSTNSSLYRDDHYGWMKASPDVEVVTLEDSGKGLGSPELHSGLNPVSSEINTSLINRRDPVKISDFMPKYEEEQSSYLDFELKVKILPTYRLGNYGIQYSSRQQRQHVAEGLSHVAFNETQRYQEGYLENKVSYPPFSPQVHRQYLHPQVHPHFQPQPPYHPHQQYSGPGLYPAHYPQQQQQQVRARNQYGMHSRPVYDQAHFLPTY